MTILTQISLGMCTPVFITSSGRGASLVSGKELPTNAGDLGSIPDPGRSHMPQSNQAHAPQP